MYGVYIRQKFCPKIWPPLKTRGKIKVRPFLGVFRCYEFESGVSFVPKFFLRPLTIWRSLTVRDCSTVADFTYPSDLFSRCDTRNIHDPTTKNDYSMVTLYSSECAYFAVQIYRGLKADVNSQRRNGPPSPT